MDVFIHLAVNQQQLSLQIFHAGLVRLLAIVIGNGEAHVAFDPHRFVEAVVVIARRRDAHLVKIGVGENGAGGGIAARRVPVNSHARQIEIGVTISKLAQCADVILQSSIPQIVVADMVLRF